MDSKKRRSSLRKSKSDVVSKDIKTQLKRRISFSGKNSVRVFHGEEEPKTWNNSYEISDHLNNNETVSNTCVPSPCTTIQSALKNTQEINENVDKFSTTQQYLENLSISNDNTVFSSSKDMINVLYQNSKMYQIENSVDVTLYEREMKFQMEEGEIGEQTNNLCSFSLEDNEKETHSNKFCEKTIDFMQELRNDTTITGEDVTKTDDFLDEKTVPVSSKYMDEGECRNPKEEITIYMNGSLSISSNEQISDENKNAANNGRTILQDKTMQFSPSKSKHHNKENVNPFQGQSANKNNIQAIKNTNCNNKEPNIKSRSTINSNEAMEVSPKDTNSLKNTIQSGPTSFLNLPIETSSIYMRSRPTINFNRTIELSPKNPNKISKEDNVQIDNNSIFFNQTIKVDSQTLTDGTNNKHVATPKSKSRPTICFNQPIDTSPSTVKENLPKNTVQLSEGLHVAPKQLSQEPEEIFSQPNVCVEKESIAFQEKINWLCVLHESEDDIQARNNTHCDKKESNIKSRSTIYCNVAIEESPKDTNSLKNTIQFCPSFFNLPIETSSIYMRSRPTINFNKTIEFSPKNLNKISKEDNVLINNTKPRTSIYLNQTIKDDSQNVTDQENNRHGVIPKLNSPPTNCFDKPVEASPSTVKATLPKIPVHLSEDMHVSPVKLTQEPFPNNDLNVLSVRQLGQQPKLVTRKICAPLVNKAKNTIDLEQERMLRYKKKQEQNITSDHAKDNEAVVLETDKFTNADQSINFSLSSVKNMSLSLESSSPLIPSEFKAYNFKQLNDEIECGKINVFLNAPKTPTTDQKARFAASKNVQLTHIPSKQRKTQVFDDVDIPISCNDTLKNDLKTTKSNTYFDVNTTQDIKAKERKNNVKCHYSQADDIMLDNTSFFTHAKLSDETVSCNSSKRELTQSEDIMEIIDDSLLREADSKKRKSCNEQNNTLGSMFQNTKPIFTQNITKTKDYNNFINKMDNSNESITNVDSKNLHQRRTVVLNHEIETCHNISNNTVEPVENNMEKFYNSCAMSNVVDKNEMKNTNLGQKRQTLFLNEDIGNGTLSDDSTGEILHFENKMPLENESIGIQQIALDEQNALNNAIDKNDIKNTNLGQKRQTLFLNEDIGGDDATRKTLYLEKKMPLEKGSIEIQQIPLDEENALNNAIDKNDTKKTNLGQKRQTLFLNEDIGDVTLTDDGTSKILYLENKMPLEKESIGIHQIPLHEENALYNAIDKNDMKNTNLGQKRQTLFLNEDIGGETITDDATRKILYLENKMPLEKESIEIQQIPLDEENALNNAIDKNDLKNTNLGQKRQTLFLNEDIGGDDATRKTLYLEKKMPLEKGSIEIQQIPLDEENALNNAIDKNDIKNTNLGQKRQTLFLNEDIGDVTLTDDATSKKLYLENKMPLEKESIGIHQIPLDEENALNNAIDKNDIKNTKLGQKRQTLFLYEDIGDVTLTDDATSKILYLENKMPLEKEENALYNEIDKNDIKNTNLGQKRQTLFLNEDIGGETVTDDVTREILYLENKMLSEKESIRIQKIPLAKENAKSNAIDKNDIKNKNLGQKRQTLFLDQDMEVTLSGIVSKVPNNSNNYCLQKEQEMDLSIDQYFTPAENEQFIPAEPLNAAKISLARQISTNSLSNKLISKQQLSLITPVKCTDSNTNHRLLCITPRLSDLEFSAEEKKSKEDDEAQCPLRTETNNKRLPVNLTPVLSIPKKRQTLVFDDCLMDESVISPPNERMSSSKKLESEVEQTRTEKPLHEIKRVICGEEMHISGIIPNESICQTPSKEKKSRIPIPISSGKKSKKSFSSVDTSSNNHLEAEDYLDMEVDNFGESIQLMRRVTTFTDERNTSIGHNGLDADLLLVGKPFIFEGNPITISDVSAFYEAQRKSNSVAQQTDMSLAENQIDTSGLNAIEKEKTSSENRYLNLTLEDIDKTRLSLVRLSYEDSTGDNKHESALEQEHNCTEGHPPPNVDLKSKINSVKHLRNASIVCRKCKRCQDTLLNETSSSVSGSFVLPELPPVPDLGLARLRRLRKRPTIADVNVLWQRVSLDRTIINPQNISDGDVDDETEKSGVVEKFIQNYEQAKKSFEMDLLEKKQNKSSLEKLPFVVRLDTLLRTKLTNWIFDYQMQYRGLLVFTHKQMYTFSLTVAFEEVDPLGHEIRIKSVKLEKGQVPEKNWKAIDFVLDFQFKLNLPFDLKSLCKGSNEADVFTMLQIIDKMCLDTVKIGISLQQISYTNHASIIRIAFFQVDLCKYAMQSSFKIIPYMETNRDECRTYVRKNIRQINTSTVSGFKYVDKTEIKVELLNLEKLSFRDIVSPRLYNFREEIHLLPTGLQFLEEFLPNPLSYIKG